MCVICHAAKKRYFRREEVQEAMRRNDAGFFIAALHPDGKRDSIRTMSQKEVLDFFDKSIADDDAVVMHARIPSHGTRGLENVHGWEEDGIVFSHNMTLSGLNEMMRKLDWGSKTDSEFFFRKLFIPYYRGLGKEAYKDGKFHPDLQAFVEFFCGGYNKFCFIMPDNVVIRVGNWVCEKDRLTDDGQVGFWASNDSYKPYVPSLKSTRSGFAADVDDFGDEFAEYGYGYGGYGVVRGREKAQPQKDPYDGKLVFESLGLLGILKLAVCDWAMQNVVSARSIVIGDGVKGDYADAYGKVLGDLLPRHFNDDGYAILADFLPEVKTEADVVSLAKAYAPHLEKMICTEGGKFPKAQPCEFTMTSGLRAMDTVLNVARMTLNVDFNFATRDPVSLVTAYEIKISRKGNPSMTKLDPGDILGLACMKVDESYKVFGLILKAMRDEAEKELAKRTKKAEVEKAESPKDAVITVTANKEGDD